MGRRKKSPKHPIVIIVGALVVLVIMHFGLNRALAPLLS